MRFCRSFVFNYLGGVGSFRSLGLFVRSMKSIRRRLWRHFIKTEKGDANPLSSLFSIGLWLRFVEWPCPPMSRREESSPFGRPSACGCCFSRHEICSSLAVALSTPSMIANGRAHLPCARERRWSLTQLLSMPLAHRHQSLRSSLSAQPALTLSM